MGDFIVQLGKRRCTERCGKTIWTTQGQLYPQNTLLSELEQLYELYIYSLAKYLIITKFSPQRRVVELHDNSIMLGIKYRKRGYAVPITFVFQENVLSIYRDQWRFPNNPKYKGVRNSPNQRFGVHRLYLLYRFAWVLIVLTLINTSCSLWKYVYNHFLKLLDN